MLFCFSSAVPPQIYFFFLSLLAAPAFAVPLAVFILFLRCLPILGGKGNDQYDDSIIVTNTQARYYEQRIVSCVTYAVACWPSQSWWHRHIGPGGSGVRTSSAHRASRKPDRSQLTCHHHIGYGNRRRKHRPYPICTSGLASRGVRPWKRLWRKIRKLLSCQNPNKIIHIA